MSEGKPPTEHTSSENLNQTAAIRHKSGPMLVLAGPGSGKTFVITRRIKYLIEYHDVEPSSILVITFTKAAAREMKERFVKLSEGKPWDVNFGTFHAVYYHILRNTYHNQASGIATEYEKKEALRTALMHPDIELPEELSGDESLPEELLSEISRYKNYGAPAVWEDGGCLETALFKQIYVLFNKQLESMGKLDFDDMVLKCQALLKKRKDVLEGWQKKFRYILIDEFQDINPVQYDVIRMLALPENNLFAVGDDDQAIYAFRGSKPEIMLNFQKDYPDARRILLDVNYRSTPEITDRSAMLISANKTRYPKKVLPTRPHGSPVEIKGFTTREEQNEYLARILRDAQEQDCSQRKEDGKLQSVAVLYRTNRDALALAEKLTLYKVPFVMREKVQSPYRQPVPLDLLAYLSFAMLGRKRQDFYRIMNRPVRYISRSAVAEGPVNFTELMKLYGNKPYMRDTIRKMQIDTERIARMNLYAAVNYIRKGMGYDAYLHKSALENGKPVSEFLSQADFFQEQARKFMSLAEWMDHIEVFEKELERQSGRQEEPEGAVRIMTMHASKGLEFNTVYLPDCNEGVVPHKKSMQGQEAEEERRMFYVAMTRAKDFLTLLYVRGTDEERGLASRFLYDLALRGQDRASLPDT